MIYGARYTPPAATKVTGPPAHRQDNRGGIGWDAAFAAWLGGRPSTTVQARAQDLRALADYLEVADGQAAALALVLAGEGTARALLHAWTAKMRDVDELAASTIARRLATVASLFRELRFHGLDWKLEVRRPKVPRYSSARRCPAWTEVLDVGRRLEQDGDPQKRAALWLLADVGLRRAELVFLRCSSWLADVHAVRVHRKGGYVEDRTVSKRCERALVELVAMRDDDDAPLFVGQRGPLTVDGLAEWTHAWGFGGPHSLRAAGATELHRRGASATMIQAWLGHASLSTTQIYVRRLDDDAGKATAYLEAIAA
jgi:integrase